MKDVIKSLEKYVKECKARMEEVPKKHEHRETAYKAFLAHELSKTQKRIDELKLMNPGGKK